MCVSVCVCLLESIEPEPEPCGPHIYAHCEVWNKPHNAELTKTFWFIFNAMHCMENMKFKNKICLEHKRAYNIVWSRLEGTGKRSRRMHNSWFCDCIASKMCGRVSSCYLYSMWSACHNYNAAIDNSRRLTKAAWVVQHFEKTKP